jgi:hypothetical protein
MPAWPALIVAPLVALTHLSIVYALATPSCRTQSEALLHGVSIVALAVALACTAMALAAWLRAPEIPGDAHERRRFVAGIGTGVGALASVVIVAIWIPPWWLSPCWS